MRLFEASGSHTNDLRFSQFKPGQISDELRQMVGLKKGQLPPWTYNMRKLGYPPGWLDEALVRESGVSVQEEGEVNEISISGSGVAKKVVGIDSSKIVQFEGFNCPSKLVFGFQQKRFSNSIFLSISRNYMGFIRFKKGPSIRYICPNFGDFF